MSCCAEKTGLARHADDPRIILFAYLCALLPLAAIYALDFINESWKSIRQTRRGGQIHLAFSLPPLATVIFYIHIQKLAEDYKEMATAITAAILCILHVLRTVWGLVQLCAFKKWNVHALHVLTRMGFKVPSKAGGAKMRARARSEDSSTESESSTRTFSIRTRVLEYLSLPLRFAGKVPVLRKIGKQASRAFSAFFSTRRYTSHAAHIERVVDKYMMVNNSLVDNEFTGAELPCRPSFWFVNKLLSKKRPSVTDFMMCTQPEECAVRWIASFLARFGPEWLIETKQAASFKKDIFEGNNLSNMLGSLIALMVTHKVEVALENGEPSSQLVSILSPLHLISGDLHEPWTKTLHGTENNALPFPICREGEQNELDFDEYSTSIQNVLTAWHKKSLHELEDAEKEAVTKMNSVQVALFSKLMEEQNPQLHSLSVVTSAGMNEIDCRNFLLQLGHTHIDDMDDIDSLWDVLQNSICVFPFIGKIASVEPSLLGDDIRHSIGTLLQASVHVDNWLALQTGTYPCSFDEVKNEISDADMRQWGHVFSAQKRVEWCRLQSKIADGKGREARVLGKVKFLGCVMETVRTFLAHWLNGSRDDTGTEDSTNTIDASDRPDPALVDWQPSINQSSCIVRCSDQLHEALQEPDRGQSHFVGDDREILQRKGLQMRVLWEIQLALVKEDNICPSSPHLMMLCMLGYPSLRLSYSRSCSETHHFSQESAFDAREGHNPDVFIPVGAVDEAQDAQNDPQPSIPPLQAASRTHSTKYSCIRIDIMEAPQPLHITFHWNSGSRRACVSIGCNDGHAVTQFCWQSWKDGFMGRISALSEWRSTRLEQSNDGVRADSILSKLSEGIGEVSQSEEKFVHWQGWPPFRSAIAAFERDVSRCDITETADLDAKLHLVARSAPEAVSNQEETEVESVIDNTLSEVECGCGCSVHNTFLEAKRLSENQQGKDALKLYKDCVSRSRHCPALERWVSDVINKFPQDNRIVSDLIYTMRRDMAPISEEMADGGCLKFTQYDLKKMIELFGKLHDKLPEQRYQKREAFYLKGGALLSLAQQDNSAVHRCLETLERFLISYSGRSYSSESHFCLAVCHFQRYISAGRCTDKELGTKHFTSLYTLSSVYSWVLALLLEKGSFSRREYTRTLMHLKYPLPEEIDIDALFESSFLWSSNVKFRLPRNEKAAFHMYKDVVLARNGYAWRDATMHAANRMALMYRQGAGDITHDLSEAETLYGKMMEVYEKALPPYREEPDIRYYVVAMCNLAVLYDQQKLYRDSGEKSMHLLRSAVAKCQEQELGSSALNNLAVMNESGELTRKNVDEAKKLYRQSVEIDENPIAVLLKFEDPSPANQREAEKLFSTVADLGADLKSIPTLAAQLEKARCVCAEEVSRGFEVVVEEIDDCLAYVKVVGSSC